MATGSALARFSDTLKYLDDCYTLRYQDAFGSLGRNRFSWSPDRVDPVDELMCVVAESTRTPFELKYTTSLFGVIYSHLYGPGRTGSQSYRWLIEKNVYLAAQHDRYAERCEAVASIASSA